jgi:hypothetical protein
MQRGIFFFISRSRGILACGLIWPIWASLLSPSCSREYYPLHLRTFTAVVPTCTDWSFPWTFSMVMAPILTTYLYRPCFRLSTLSCLFYTTVNSSNPRYTNYSGLLSLDLQPFRLQAFKRKWSYQGHRKSLKKTKLYVHCITHKHH